MGRERYASESFRDQNSRRGLCLADVVLDLHLVFRTDIQRKLGPPADSGAVEVEDVDGYRHEHGQTPEQCGRPLERM